MATQPPDWLLLTISIVLALSSATVILWALFADRSRGRRRCRKCGYSMKDLPGLQCPECGHTARSERQLFATRRRWRWAVVGCFLAVLAVPPLAHWHYRDEPGGWWNVAPMSVLLSHTDEREVRTVILQRIDDGNPETGYASSDALSQDHWQRLTEASHDILLTAASGSSGHTWSIVMLGHVIPLEHSEPAIRDLILHGDGDARASGVFAAHGFALSRGPLRPSILDALAQAACESEFASDAALACNVLARITPLPSEHLYRVVHCIASDPSLSESVRHLHNSIGSPNSRVSLEDRLEFVATLEASDDPAIRALGVSLRQAVTDAQTESGSVKDRR